MDLVPLKIELGQACPKMIKNIILFYRSPAYFGLVELMTGRHIFSARKRDGTAHPNLRLNKEGCIWNCSPIHGVVIVLISSISRYATCLSKLKNGIYRGYSMNVLVHRSEYSVVHA